MIPHNLPSYVERGGEQVRRAPYTARGAEVFGFVLAADQSAIDSLVQRDLVAPTRGACDYRCAHAHILVTFAQIDRLASGDPVDSQRGYLPEREVSIWCLVADAASPGPASRLLWYLPYVFTDSGQTVATGREVYGYPKQVGIFEDDYPTRLENGGATTVAALSLDPYDPNQSAAARPMISVVRTPGGGTLPAGASWSDEISIWFPGGFTIDPSIPVGPPQKGSATITPPNAPPPPGPTPLPPWIQGLLNAFGGQALTGLAGDMITDMIGGGSLTLVFLKQFRDVECPTRACYQAVIESPITVDPVGASYDVLDPGLFALTVESWASHPIAKELGLSAGKALTPERAFRAAFNFDINLGVEVWRAPT